MDNKTHEVRREHWEKIILECNNREAGISKREWCQLNGISLKSFYYWQRRFRSEVAASMGTTVALQKAQNHPQFIDITDSINVPPQEKAPYCGRADFAFFPELMIQICDCQIYAGSSVSEKALETVMKVLRNV